MRATLIVIVVIGASLLAGFLLPAFFSDAPSPQVAPATPASFSPMPVSAPQVTTIHSSSAPIATVSASAARPWDENMPFPPKQRPSWCRQPPQPQQPRTSNFSTHGCFVPVSREVPFTRRDRNVRPRIAVVTLTGSNPTDSSGGTSQRRGLTGAERDEIRIISFSNKLAFCRTHSYDLIVESAATLMQDPEFAPLFRPDGPDGVASRHGNPLAWAKLLLVRKVLLRGGHDWVAWMDHDALVLNFSARLEDVVDARVAEIERDLGVGTQRSASRLSPGEIARRYMVKKRLGMPHRIDEVNLRAPKRSIDLLLIAEPGGINSGVFFARRTNWTVDFLRRVVFDVPVHVRSRLTLWDQDALSFMINLHASAHPRDRNADRAQIEADRAHVFILENNEWNAPWRGMLAFPYMARRVPQLQRDWVYHTPFTAEEELALAPALPQFERQRRQRMEAPTTQQESRSYSNVVHFVGCLMSSACLPWMRYEFEKAISVNGGFEIAADCVPATYYPPGF